MQAKQLESHSLQALLVLAAIESRSGREKRPLVLPLS